MLYLSAADFALLSRLTAVEAVAIGTSAPHLVPSIGLEPLDFAEDLWLAGEKLLPDRVQVERARKWRLCDRSASTLSVGPARSPPSDAGTRVHMPKLLPRPPSHTQPFGRKEPQS